MDNKKQRYSKIGSEITNMLEDASQSITCDFATSQHHRNVPSQVHGIAACGWAYKEQAGQTAAISNETSAMVCDGLRCF